MANKSKILVIGGTGYIGKYLVEESAKSGHPTFALARESSLSHPQKSKIIDTFKNYGVTLIFVCSLETNSDYFKNHMQFSYLVLFMIREI